MKSKSAQLCLVLVLGALAVRAAEADKPVKLVQPKSLVGADLFPDPVLAKGKGVEIKQSQVDEAFLAFKASRAAAGQSIPEANVKKIQEQILDKIIGTQLCLNRATEADRKAGNELADKFIGDLKAKAPSEESFKRQLIAEGTTLEQFRAQVLEQAIVKSVIDREVRDVQKIAPADIRKFYDENPDKLMQPEQAKVAHILLTTKNVETGEVLAPAVQAAKKEKIQKALSRARAGEDFAKLIKEYSEDVKQPGGEYTFARGTMPPEFEAASWTLQPGKISDIVTSIYGFHIIKLIEKIPAKKLEYDKVQDKIKETLLQETVQKAIPAYIKKLGQEADVKIITPD